MYKNKEKFDKAEEMKRELNGEERQMGKKRRSYSIFILFLLMSMSVFADSIIGVKSVDVTKYPKIKIILTGNNGNKNILNNRIEETSGFNLPKPTNPMGDNKTEVIYITPIKTEVKFEDRVEVELYIYTGNVKNGNWINTSYTVPKTTKDIEIKTYEEIHGWGTGERTTVKDSGIEYVFTKGGDYFQTTKPIIYVEIPEGNIDEKGKREITKLKVEKLNSDGSVIGEKNLK